MMSGFDRGYGWTPRFDAINEVLLVIVRFVERDRSFAFGQFPEPIHIRGVVASTVHPDPAVGPDPFGAAANVRVAPGQSQRDVLGILADNAILSAGVPHRIRRRKLARA